MSAAAKNPAQPLIVGAGPAGIRAAATLVAAGLRPIVVDEAPACGGQIYRQPLVPDGRDARARYGSEAPKAKRLHGEFAALQDKLDYLPNSLVWNLADGIADVAMNGAHKRLVHDGLILATGAMDRILPVPGWTLPGVFSLGGSQIALKAQGCVIGSRVVFVGTGPLLYLVAWQYLKAGVKVVAVLDAAPFSARVAMVKALPGFPAIVLRGARFVAEMMMKGVAFHYGINKLRFEGTHRVEGVSFEVRGKPRHLSCDGAGFGLGLKSEAQLADLAGCRFAFNERDRVFLPETDEARRSSVPGVYLAGDGSGIAGADAAELSGERAALSLLDDRGLAVDRARVGLLERELRKIFAFRTVLEQSFPFPAHWIADLPGNTTVCRCEEIDVSTIRDAADHFGIVEMNRLKAVSRVGMGRCQGRVCGAAAAELLAAATGQPISAVGRLRGQAPVKPLPMSFAELALPAIGEAAE
ncbi:FAD-dependent oxidoreductase [Rhizobium sp. SL86]|uniref:FAD-dependent oxidoreductase n=1 Tax=Rhizobium sp. SL86 TaxID=2995148 RepID=UPI002273A198|nr:FAD-dependent oxidoreductase [Rhizobium sp. SL86]MCY1666349.1 FAD-dependent oxidoreductase [Rhizobium sp. SL86]